MVRTKSLLLRNAIFGAACVVFAAVLVFRGEATKASNESTGLGPAFPPIKVEKVQALELEQTTTVAAKPVKESVRLVRTGPAAWKLASSFDYPADTGKVESYLKALGGVKKHSEPTSNPAKFADFAGTDGFLEVRLFESDAAPSLSFGIGKANSDGGYSSKKFVRVDDGAPSKSGRVLVVSDLDAYGSPTSPTYWIETRLLPALTSAEVAEFSIEQGEAHRSISFVRGKKKDEKDRDDPWNMTAPTAEPALAEPVMGLVRGFVGLTLASIEAGKASPADDAKYGFDKPDLILRGTGKAPADSLQQPTWTVRIGKKVEGKSAWYARRSTGEAVDPFVFTVDDYSLTDFRKDPTTYVEKTPEAAAQTPPPIPEPESRPGPAMDGEPPAMGDVPPAAPPAPTNVPPAMSDAPVAPSGMDAVPPAPAPDAPKVPETPKAPPAPKPPETPKHAPPAK